MTRVTEFGRIELIEDNGVGHGRCECGANDIAASQQGRFDGENGLTGRKSTSAGRIANILSRRGLACKVRTVIVMGIRPFRS